MSTKQLNFSSFLFLVDGNFPELEIFRSIFKENENFNFNYSDTYFNIETLYSDKRYCFFYIEAGKPTPRSEHLYDISTGEEEDNPRTLNQIEPAQYFILIDFKSSKVWLSNQNKRGFLKNLTHNQLEAEEVLVKSVIDEESFLKEITKISQISFSATPNLFSQIDKLSSVLCDNIYGYDATVAKLTLDYNEKPINDNIFQRIKNLFNKRESLDEIVVSGRDYEERELIFNKNLFMKRVLIKPSVNENEKFDKYEVFNLLKEEIKRYE